MVRFKLKSELIQVLKLRGIVSSDDKMKMSVPYRTQGKKEQMFEVEFGVDEVIGTDNRLAILAIKHKHSPQIKINSEWYVADPSVPWFDQLEEGEGSSLPVKIVNTPKNEVLTHSERKAIHLYTKATGAAKPSSWKRKDSSEVLVLAQSYFRGYSPAKRSPFL